MVESHVPEFVLSTWKANHTAHPAAGFSAGCTAELDLEFVIIISILSPVVNY